MTLPNEIAHPAHVNDSGLLVVSTADFNNRFLQSRGVMSECDLAAAVSGEIQSRGIVIPNGVVQSIVAVMAVARH